MPPKNRRPTGLPANAVELTKSHNPPGIRIIEFALKKTEFYRDQSLIAGYLKNCANTEKLRSIIVSVSALFETHATLRLNSWTSTPTSKPVDAGNPGSISLFRFLSRLQTNRLAADLLNNGDPEPTPEKVANVFGAMEPKILRDITGYLITTNILIKVIVQMPHHFDSVYEFDPENGIFMPNFEDLHRSYCLLRIWSRLNEEARKNKGKTSKPQNNPAQLVHYLDESMDENRQAGYSGLLFESDDLLTYEAPSVPASDDEEALSELDVVKLLDDALEPKDEKDFIDLQQNVNNLPPLTDAEKNALYRYAKENLNIRYDRWNNIGTDERPETDVDVEIQNIIQQVHDSAKQAEKYDLMDKNEVGKDHSNVENVLDHASMETHTIEHAASYLDLDIDRPALFPGIHSGVTLLEHQMTVASTMLDLERLAHAGVANKTPVLQAGILADDMGLGKTVEILALIYFAYQKGLQVSGPRIAPSRPTLVCIPPAVALGWYSDYNRFFCNQLKMFFVGSAFRHGSDPLFQSCCISSEIFRSAMKNPEKSTLFRNPDDIGRTIFVISHHTLTKYTVERSMLSQDNNDAEQQPLSDLQADRKLVRTPKKTKCNPTPDEDEAEDQQLLAEESTFETYLVNYTSLFPNMFARFVLDEGHVVRHPNSGISRAAKLLAPSFLWIVTATPLLNKTRDFYGYSQLLYNSEWPLDLRDEFVRLSTVEKFEQAKTNDEILELFNPLYIRRLATKGHIDAALAALTIPVLLRRCMIRRTGHTKIRGRKISESIPRKHINSVVMTFNRAEQLEYCEIHSKNTKAPLESTGLSENGELEGKMDARRVKNLLCASFSPRFHTLHRRVGQDKTKAGKLKTLTSGDGAGLLFFLKNTHDSRDYQYAIPSTRIDRARELLNISPSLRYIMQVLYEVVTLEKRHLTLYCETPAVAWSTLMFCLNYGAQTAWLRAGITQAERDRIVTNFTNDSGALQVLISTHQVGGFGINLQANCSRMVIVELPRNLNTLLQTQARLVRIGQNEEVKIWILFTDHSFQRWWAANLARKAISDLSAQLASKLTLGEKADTQTIEHHGEQALNVIMNWHEDRAYWKDERALDLASSLLSKSQQQKYAFIGKTPIKAIEAPPEKPERKRKRESEAKESLPSSEENVSGRRQTRSLRKAATNQEDNKKTKANPKKSRTSKESNPV